MRLSEPKAVGEVTVHEEGARVARPEVEIGVTLDLEPGVGPGNGQKGLDGDKLGGLPLDVVAGGALEHGKKACS